MALAVAKVGSFTVEYGVKGRELERKIAEMAEKFVRDMELRGFTLVRGIPGNPTVVCNEDGSPMATYAIDWEAAARGEVESRDIPTNLEMSRGLVDYRIVGVFWSPERTIEILTTVEDIRERERMQRNPVSFLMVKSFTPNSSNAQRSTNGEE